MAGKKPFMNVLAGLVPAFHIPQVENHGEVGQQVMYWGESHVDYGMNVYTLQHTPTPVNSLSTLANNSGQARERGLQVDNNSYGDGGVENYLFLGGTLAKSKG